MYRSSLKITGNSSILIAIFIFYYTLFIGFFTYNFNVPDSVLYVGDAFNVILLAMCLKRITLAIGKTPLRTFIIMIVGACVVGLFSALIYGFDIVLFYVS